MGGRRTIATGSAVLMALAVVPGTAGADRRPPRPEAVRLVPVAGGWALALRLPERARLRAVAERVGAGPGRARARVIGPRALAAGGHRIRLGALPGGRWRVRMWLRDPAGNRARASAQADVPIRLVVAAGGDLLIHAPVAARAREYGRGQGYAFAPMLRPVRPLLRRADLALCHMEVPMAPGTPQGYPLFRAPPALAGAVAAAGVDACSTASNHSLDMGRSGVASTLAALRRAGVAGFGTAGSAAGARRPVIVTRSGVRVGLVAATEMTNGIPLPDPWSVRLASATAILRAAGAARRAGAQAVIVNVHWGEEYRTAPTDLQWRLARALTRSPDVTAVVGQHVHVVQPVRWVNGKPVVFGMGNLLSNQQRPEQRGGMIALLDLVVTGRRARAERVRYLPTWVAFPGFEVTPAARAEPTSWRRTVAVAGRGARTRPLRG
jgi:poly-gamma-glutamate synthesis protein (capsule biosynthesis protein)